MTSSGGQAAAPVVSVGLAVYNGEEYLEAALQSILAQSYTNFELIISDNDSTDATGEICRGYAKTDRRIRYSRNPVNIGGVRNENRTFYLARGKYFKLAAHDDLVAPTFLERCVEVLDDRPDVDVCFTAVVPIDEHGSQAPVRRATQGTESRPHQRMLAISSRSYSCEATYGLIRSEALRRTRLQKNHTHSDRVLLCELAASAPFYMVDEPLFFKRHHAKNVHKDWRGRMAWYQPELKETGGVRLPHWQQFGDYVGMLMRVSLSPSERVLCALAVGRWAFDLHRSLAGDIVDAGRMLARPRQARRSRYRDEESWL